MNGRPDRIGRNGVIGRIGGTMIFIVLLSVATPSTAHAYLDPGTGSLIVQSIIGGVVGVLVAAKLYWVKLKSVFSRRPPAVERDRTTDGER